MSCRVRQRRCQSGFTLVEMMIAMVVGTMIAIPVMGWITMTYRQNAEQSHRARADNVASLARITFGRDVASADSVTIGGDDCTDAVTTPTSTTEAPTTTTVVGPSTTEAPTSTVPPPASVVSPPNVVMLLSLGYDDNGNSASRTVYRVETEGERATLQRRRCDATGQLVSSDDLGDGLVEPTGGWSSMASCGQRPGYPTGDCGQVTLAITTKGRTDRVTVKLRTGPPR